MQDSGQYGDAKNTAFINSNPIFHGTRWSSGNQSGHRTRSPFKNAYPAGSRSTAIVYNRLSFRDTALIVQPMAPPDSSSSPLPRRGLLTWSLRAIVALGTMAAAATGALWAAAIGRFFFANAIAEPSARFRAGRLVEYPRGTVVTKYRESHGVWIVHALECGSLADCRAADALHASRLHHPVDRRRWEIQVSLPRQRVSHRRRPCRRPRAAAVGALCHSSAQRRPTRGRR